MRERGLQRPVGGRRPASPAGASCTRMAHAPGWSTSSWWRSRCTTSRRGRAHQAAAGRGYRRRAVPERRRGRRRFSSVRSAGAMSAAGSPISPLGSRRPGVIRHTGSMARLAVRRAVRQPFLAARDAAGGVPRGRDRRLLSPAIAAEIWRKFVFLAPFAGITCFGRDLDRRGPRGSAAVAPVQSHGRGGGRGGAGLRRRPAAGRGGASAWSSPASCRPRCARRCCRTWRPAAGWSWTG